VPNLTGQPSPTERVFVAILTLTDGTEAESLPFPDRDTADRVGRGSLLDAEVADYRVEERPDPPTCPDCGGLLWRCRGGDHCPACLSAALTPG